VQGILLALILSFCAQTASALTIATGPSGGSYFQVAQDIKNVARKEGIDLRVMATRGSLENLELLDTGKVDLAIVQADAVWAMGYSNAQQFISDVVKQDLDMDLFGKIKVVLNLYREEIHILTNKKAMPSFDKLQGKRVSIGLPGGGSAVTAVVLFKIYGVKATVSGEPFEEAVGKLEQGSLDAVLFVGGAPVPFIERLGGKLQFVRLPRNPALEQIYLRTSLGKKQYSWAGTDMDTYAVPAAMMGLDKRDEKYVAQMQRLVLAILDNRQFLQTKGHPKWQSSIVRTYFPSRGYEPTNQVIEIFNILDKYGYKVTKQ
jgi:TRAP transporter TAXI family solute receptor